MNKNNFSHIIISGLGYSGKTAIIDFLYYNGIVRGLIDDYPSESYFFDSRQSIISKLPVDKKTALTEIRLSITRTIGKRVDFTTRNYSKKQFIQQQEIIDKLNKLVIRYFTEKLCNTSSFTFQDYIRLIDFLIVTKTKSSNKYIVMNNDPYFYHNYKLKNSELNTTHIVVIRNPFDSTYDLIQYIKHVNLRLILRINISYGKKLYYILVKKLSNIIISKNSNILNTIIFEKFASDKDYLLNKLSSTLDLKDYSPVFEMNDWNYIDSSKNIGIGINLNAIYKVIVCLISYAPYKLLNLLDSK